MRDMIPFCVAVALIGVFSQIAVGIYELGCWRKYNRFCDRIAYWIENLDVDEYIETIFDVMILAGFVIACGRWF